MEEDWQVAYVKVAATSIPRGANTIGFRTVFKVRDDSDESLRLKARNFIHGHGTGTVSRPDGTPCPPTSASFA